MTRKLFGTDGIRGTANTAPMTADIALKVAVAAARHFRRGNHRHVVVIGKDTRLSGYMLEPALTAGFISMGMDCVLVGPIPTPAVAMLTRSLRADLGVMISASHNPYEDNGIKLFGPDGYKLNDEVEREIEALIDADLGPRLSASPKLGRAKRIDSADARYVEFAKRTLPRNLSLEGLRIVLDCANGAAYKVAPQALWELGAEVITIGVEPDGAPTLAHARAAGAPVDAPAGSIAVDALAPRRVGELVFPITQAYVEDVVLVDDDAIRTAQHTLWQTTRIAAEPAASVGVAALLSGAYKPAVGERVAVIISGANMTAAQLT